MQSPLKNIQKNLPEKSGVYLFFNQKKEAIYVGKAKNLKKRTAYYFSSNLPKRFMRMIGQAEHLEYFLTETENDAFLLEAQLIKEKRPIFNIQYKHGRSLYYLSFSNHEFPRACIVNQWQKNAIGPFLSAEYIKNLLNELMKIFKLRVCTDFVFKTRKRPCLEYFSNRCSAPCVKYIEKQEYIANQIQLESFFLGKTKKILTEWKNDLATAIKNENFEEAARKRDQIYAIEKLKQKQNIYFENIRIDVIVHLRNVFYIEFIENGGIKNIEYRKYDHNISLEEFLLEYYMDGSKSPILCVDSKILDNKNLIKLFPKYNVPKTKLQKDIIQATNSRFLSLIREDSLLPNWENFLGITELIDIETYDSSHYGGKEARCGMVCYDMNKQEFEKSRYRTWKLEHNSQNDLEILKAALLRRLKIGNLPSMILLDGGITQLNVAKEVLYPYKNIFAFAKGEKRKGGQLYNYNGDVILDDASSNKNQQLFDFLEKLRSEAHRWIFNNTSKAFSKKFISNDT